MRTAAVTISGSEHAVCDRCGVADNPWRRLRGLMGRRRLEEGEGLLLRPAGAIHTCFMRFPIDAVFCDRDMRVVAVRRSVRPWRAARTRGAKIVLELPAGAAGTVAPGDTLALGPASA